MNGMSRITVQQDEMAGFPCIRHLHITVSTIVDLIRQGKTNAEILAAHPELEDEDIRQALEFTEAIWEEDMADLTT